MSIIYFETFILVNGTIKHAKYLLFLKIYQILNLKLDINHIIQVCHLLTYLIVGLREDTTNVDENKEPLDMSFCKNPKFLAYLVTNFTLSIGYYIPPGLLPNTALSTGVSLDDISLAFSIGGIASILGRILFGFIAHRHPNQTTKLFCFFIIAMGLPMGIIPFSSTFIHYLVFSLINGFFLGNNIKSITLAI